MARKASGITASQFAQTIGIEPPRWRAFEAGELDAMVPYFVAAAADDLGLHGRLLIEGDIPPYKPRFEAKP